MIISYFGISECCEELEITGAGRFSKTLPFQNQYFEKKCVRFEATGIGSYTRTGLDENGRPIYKSDEKKGYGTDGEGFMILAFDNIRQEWKVSIHQQVKGFS